MANIYGKPIESLGIYILSEKTKQKLKVFFCRHEYKIGHILGMSALMKNHVDKLPTMVFDKSFTRCYCPKCGRIFTEEEDTFKFD